jgi:hypothetical protein
MMRPWILACLTALAAFAAHAAAPATVSSGRAKGTLSYDGKTVTFQHAYIIKGTESGKKIRRLVLEGTDLRETVAAASYFSGASVLKEGIAIDLDLEEGLPYWMAINDGTQQISNVIDPKLFKATANDAKRIAGKLVFDATARGGPKVDVEFDAAVTREFP